MGKKRKSKKRKNKSKKAPAKKGQALKKVQANKEQNQSKDLTFFQKIGRYKKWFSFGVISFFVMLYVSYYPEKLEIKPEVIGMENALSAVIVVTNTNPFKVKNVNIKIDGLIDATFKNGNSIGGIGLTSFEFIEKINPKSSKHINPNKRSLVSFSDGAEYKKIKELSINIVYSLETPFIYPDIKDETVSFRGYTKPNGELVYVYN